MFQINTSAKQGFLAERRGKGRVEMAEQWEMCRVSTFRIISTVYFYSWKDGWGALSRRDYLARFHPEWLQSNPGRTRLGDLIIVLLSAGWEPYAVYSDSFYFRRKVNS